MSDDGTSSGYEDPGYGSDRAVATHPLGGYQDWPAYARGRAPFHNTGSALAHLGAVLGVRAPAEPTPELRTEQSWEHGGLTTTRLSWSVGFGPRTVGYLIRPTGAASALPGVLGLHCHGGYKWVGAEQLVDLGPDTSAEALGLQAGYYGGLAPATELARRGFAVLTHDAFCWGSRRFELDPPPMGILPTVAGAEALWREQGVTPSAAERYNVAAAAHEHTVAKTAGILGTSLTGTVAADDLVALEILASLPEVDAERLGAFGFSGGGGRSVILAALSARVRSYVVSCMMATFESLMPHYIDNHSWLLNSPGLWRYADWPDVTAGRDGQQLLVQYGIEDPLFPIEGMQAADHRLRQLHADRYRGSFYAQGHLFNETPQREAWDFFARTLAG
ncbi:hypothetical protein GCM10009841_14620 [Microlunatus panaciterrae]|uniref:Dienelactone hydrolase n=1 Tax=Microlunatus panaciterrae TaxID=400768 RepID=A0ABS2RN68_9ACTN|nr:acetylxylan esterase [Microlunatus panaciterrae]MBM7800022.1 dienelactone hydrolase [Microlunatus panaciterrae]